MLLKVGEPGSKLIALDPSRFVKRLGGMGMPPVLRPAERVRIRLATVLLTHDRQFVASYMEI